MMRTRLILAILSTLLEEAVLALFVLLGLPRLGIHIPWPGLVAMMAILGIVAAFTYRMGSRALSKKPFIGLPNMVGSKAKVVSRLAPEGMVQVKGELWQAQTSGGPIEAGVEVIVVGQDGLKLTVRETRQDKQEKR